MSRPRPPTEPPPDPRARLDFGERGAGASIPPGWACAALGLTGLAIAGAAWTPLLSWLSWVDLPLVVLLFLASAWTALTDARGLARVMPGVLLAALSVAVSVAHLLLDRSHPWSG